MAEAQQAAKDDVHARLLQHLRSADLSTPMAGRRYDRFDAFVKGSILSDRTVRVKVWAPDGAVIYSDDKKIIGHRFALEDALAKALHGDLSSDISSLRGAENHDDRSFHRLLEVYIPIRFSPSGPVVGAFEIYQSYDPVAAAISETQRSMYELLACALFVLYILLFGIFRNGSTTIRRQQQQLERYTSDLEENYRQTIASLAAAVDARDASTELHSRRVTELAVALGRWLGLSEVEVCDLEHGALLHDVGKIGVSDTILLKPGKLTDDEWLQMRRHPEIGYLMLQGVHFLKNALPLVRHHHERWDGTGYPDRLRGEDIPFAARLFAIIDAYDAITSNRPYRDGASREVALLRLRHDAGSQFDPTLVTAFIAMMEQSSVARPAAPLLALRPSELEGPAA